MAIFKTRSVTLNRNFKSHSHLKMKDKSNKCDAKLLVFIALMIEGAALIFKHLSIFKEVHRMVVKFIDYNLIK